MIANPPTAAKRMIRIGFTLRPNSAAAIPTMAKAFQSFKVVLPKARVALAMIATMIA